MLPEAIRVIEAARKLGIRPGRAGVFVPELDVMKLPAAFRDLAQAIEAFDRATARSDDMRSLLGRAIRFAADRGIDPREMADAIRAPAPGGEIDAEAGADLVPQPGEVDAPDPEVDATVARQVAEMGGPWTDETPEPPAAHASPGDADPDHEPSTGPRPAGPGSRTAAPDVIEKRRKAEAEAQAGLAAIRALEQRIEAIAERIGWTPELKAIDADLRRAYGALETVAAGAGTVETVGRDAARFLARVEEGLEEIEVSAEAAGPSLGRR